MVGEDAVQHPAHPSVVVEAHRILRCQHRRKGLEGATDLLPSIPQPAITDRRRIRQHPGEHRGNGADRRGEVDEEVLQRIQPRQECELLNDTHRRDAQLVEHRVLLPELLAGTGHHRPVVHGAGHEPQVQRKRAERLLLQHGNDVQEVRDLPALRTTHQADRRRVGHLRRPPAHVVELCRTERADRPL
jgi:hypothetical protein